MAEKGARMQTTLDQIVDTDVMAATKFSLIIGTRHYCAVKMGRGHCRLHAAFVSCYTICYSLYHSAFSW